MKHIYILEYKYTYDILVVTTPSVIIKYKYKAIPEFSPKIVAHKSSESHKIAKS